MRTAKRLADTLAVLLVAVSAAASQQYGLTIEHDVEAKMRDGVILRADIYRPKSDEKFPVLLQRTPYDKAGAADEVRGLAAHGYIVVIQDVRGRFASDGDFYPVKNEAADGFDTVEWAATLPGSNGKVGMFGSSYIGITQFQAALTRPPHLAGLYAVDTPSNIYDGCLYQGGAFEQWLAESFATAVSSDVVDRRIRESSLPASWIRKLPLSSYPVVDPGNRAEWAPYFQDWLAHPSFDDYWKQWVLEGNYDKITVPVYTVAAWYDVFLGGSLRNYIGLEGHAGTDNARRNQRLLVVVGGHAGPGPKIGEVDFGPDSLGPRDEMLRWYDSLLKNVANGMEKQKPVKIFVMGQNQWRDEDDWPLARAHARPYYLSSSGKANSASGDGTLSPQISAGTAASDRFAYDPNDPVPTHGGPLCCGYGLQPGALDQREVESRPDVLAYTTPAFDHDLEVTGPVTLDLFVSSSAPDTDVTAKLVDVWPNSFAQNLTEGILRLRYRTSQATPQPMKPGQIDHVTIDLWATSNVFLAGYKLRLEISSSNFPRFDRNLNTGEEQAHATHWIKATNIVYHDRQHPSALVLPIVEHR
jgi:putative CocE/NonD family hydrolase